MPPRIQSRIVRFWFPSAFLLCLFAKVVGAVDLDKCKANFQNETGQTQFTYKQCLETCGGGAGVFKWKMFSDDFSTWLLPWIALMFQLPFGASDRADNLFSVLLAIGSPALAGYSLAITKLNGRWLSRQFRHLDPPNNDNTKVPLAVSALQHIPFKIDVSHPPFQSTDDNAKEEYWNTLDSAATDTRQWSIPVIMNIFWALVALTFTIVGSLVDFQEAISVPGDVGYPIVAVWSYLLPLVVGWLYVGSQLKANQLRYALGDAYKKAFPPPAPIPPAVTPPQPPKGIEYSTEFIDHDVNADEKKTAPIFNYARVFVWSQHAEQILDLYPGPKKGGGRSQHGISHRVLLAVILAHVLQWGTTGASILIHAFTPPKGFGCRALTYTIYGSAGTFSFWLLLLSSILAHKARPHTNLPPPSSTRFVGYIAILTRWSGKTIAVANGFGILIACGMQFAGLYDNCFCSSTLFGGSPDGLVKFLEPNIKGSQVYGYWIGGLILAFVTSSLYAFVLYIATPMEL